MASSFSNNGREAIYLGLGSNLGDRAGNLRTALKLLEDGEASWPESVSVDITAVSDVYRTMPVGMVDQPSFFNLVARATTSLEPVALLAFVKQVEREAGRLETFRWGPRVVDVDILLFGGRVVDTAELSIPHRELLNRAFVLNPLCDLDPDVTLPDGTAPCRLLGGGHLAGQSVKRLGPLESIED